MAIGDGVSAIASLAVTFGGFSPTAMDGVEATRQQIERVEAELAKKKEAAKRLRELEFARTSKPAVFVADDGTRWTYVVVDDSMVRVVSCETDAATLAIPSTIEDKPVYAVAADACARLESVQEIVCPDSVETIGSCAFRLCPNLRSVMLPRKVQDFSSSWLRGCDRLVRLVLPGALNKIDLSVFERKSLRVLAVGSDLYEIEPGSFQNSMLEEFSIDRENPYITTDGTGVYSSDGKVLIAMARPVESYDVKDGCVAIAKKACYGIESLREITLPESVVELGDFAFSHTGLRSFNAPKSLKKISEKVFYYCRELERVTLNDGLQSIADSAFEESGIASLTIPASIEYIGSSITVRTNVVHSGPDCSIAIEEGSKSLFLDGQGGLYRREDDGIHLVQLIDRETESYNVLPGTTFIDAGAFAHQVLISRISVPEGVTRIADNAFRFCTALRSVELPDSVEYIGKGAFLDTELERFRVPESLSFLGEDALVTRGAHHGDGLPSLRSIEAPLGNGQFYVESGMLCRHGDSGDSVIVFTSSCARVVFPERVTNIEAYAFNNARDIEYLELNKNLKIIGSNGLTTWCWIEHIHVELDEPVEGRTAFDFRFPNTPKSRHGISNGIGGASWVNVAGIMGQYDICLINSHDYHSPRNPDNIPVYDQIVRVLERLEDPVLLTQVNRDMYERLLRNHIVEISVDVARHDDRKVIDRLVEYGYINVDNLEEIIIAVGKLQDAAMTGYLLELKRRQFGRSALDFDL